MEKSNHSGSGSSSSSSQRASVLSELVETERSYVSGLECLTRVFANPIRLTPKALLLRKGIRSDHEKNSSQRLLAPEDTTSMFSNVDTLQSFHEELLRVLLERISTPSALADPASAVVGDIFVARAPFLRMYSTYLNNYQMALSTLRRIEEQNSDFRAFLASAHKDPALGGLNIVAFLLLPVQRIPRYRLLLEALCKATPETHSDYTHLHSALQKVGEIADQVNEKIRFAEHAHKVVEVQIMLGSSYEGHLVEPTRRLLHQGELYKVSRHAVQKRAFFLFNDLLLYAKGNPFRATPHATTSAAAAAAATVAAEGSCEYKGEILLGTSWVNDLPNTKLLQNGDSSLSSSPSLPPSAHFSPLPFR